MSTYYGAQLGIALSVVDEERAQRAIVQEKAAQTISQTKED